MSPSILKSLEKEREYKDRKKTRAINRKKKQAKDHRKRANIKKIQNKKK